MPVTACESDGSGKRNIPSETKHKWTWKRTVLPSEGAPTIRIEEMAFRIIILHLQRPGGQEA